MYIFRYDNKVFHCLDMWYPKSQCECTCVQIGHIIYTLYIVVFSFIEIVPHLDGANFLLSVKFNQDAVEIFFGKQRARCGRGDNPTLTQTLYNTQSIRTSRSMSFGWCSGIQKKRLFLDTEELSHPLRKRRKISKKT